MNESQKTRIQRTARARRVRARLVLNEHRPRLVIDRSNRSINAQIIDLQGKVIAVQVGKKAGGKTIMEMAQNVGTKIAELALAKGVKEVALDRKHYRYHGRIKALADAAREKGLKV